MKLIISQQRLNKLIQLSIKILNANSSIEIIFVDGAF